MGGREKTAEREQADYRPGTIVPVYYNPTNHGKVVIKPGVVYAEPWAWVVELLIIFTVAAASGLGVFGVCMLVRCREQVSRNSGGGPAKQG